MGEWPLSKPGTLLGLHADSLAQWLSAAALMAILGTMVLVCSLGGMGWLDRLSRTDPEPSRQETQTQLRVLRGLITRSLAELDTAQGDGRLFTERSGYCWAGAIGSEPAAGPQAASLWLSMNARVHHDPARARLWAQRSPRPDLMPDADGPSAGPDFTPQPALRALLNESLTRPAPNP